MKFITGLKPSFQEELSECLTRQAASVAAEEPQRDEEDAYKLEQVIKTATSMVDAAAVGPFGALTYVEEETNYSQEVVLGSLSS